MATGRFSIHNEIPANDACMAIFISGSFANGFACSIRIPTTPPGTNARAKTTEVIRVRQITHGPNARTTAREVIRILQTTAMVHPVRNGTKAIMTPGSWNPKSY